MIEVVVGNIGSVYVGDNPSVAEQTYDRYVERSLEGIGRAGAEPVYYMRDGEIVKAHERDGFIES